MLPADAFSQAALVCFEINIFNTVIRYWDDSIHPAVFISVLIVLYLCLNIWSVSLFGETEFWLALGKVGLIFALLLYTIISVSRRGVCISFNIRRVQLADM